MECIKEEKRETFIKLAEQCSSFPKWKEEYIFQKSIMRNATSNNSAPTGIIFVIADPYYSIAPVVALAYNRVGILNN